jgi:hypothetical protein
MQRILPSVTGWLMATSLLIGASPDDIKGFAPVSVSSANYRDTDRAELRRITEQSAVNAEAPSLAPLDTPVYFVFVPGEITLPDPKRPEPTYEELCLMLTPALAKKGYLNAADEFGIIREPEKVTLVLRVHYGERDWRLPVVRTDQLTWSDGMVPRPRGRSLTTLGGDVVWDSRAGGNDSALSAGARNDANTQSFFGSGGGAASASEAISAALTNVNSGDLVGAYAGTRSFHLIAVDAFDYAELKEKGKAARRLWTTMVAAPKQGKGTFADMASTLIRNATPFFGETSRGLQVYTDARAEVTIGEAVVVPDSP